MLGKLFKKDHGLKLTPTNDLENDLEGLNFSRKTREEFMLSFFDSEVIALGASQFENGFEKIVFDKFSMNNETAVIAFTSHSSYSQYLSADGVTSRSVVKLNGFNLAQCLLDRAGIRLNRGHSLGVYLSVHEVSSLVKKHRTTIMESRSIKVFEEKEGMPKIEKGLLTVLKAFTIQRENIADMLIGIRDIKKGHREVLIAILFYETRDTDVKVVTFNELRGLVKDWENDGILISIREIRESLTWISAFKANSLTSILGL